MPRPAARGKRVTDSGISDAERPALASIDVLVLAGGLGTRIRPVLGDVPKVLAPIAGKPYLDYLLDWLRQFGIRRIVLGLGHRADAVLAHLQARPAGGLDIATVIEPAPLGTAGAIRLARSELHSDPVLVMNGDSFADVDLGRFLASHRRAKARGNILCAMVEDAGRYGRVILDGGGHIQSFAEKNVSFHGAALVNAGVYLLSADLLDEIAAGHAVSLERDVFERMPPGSLAAFTECRRFIDIGTPESLAWAGEVFGAATPSS